MPVAVMDLSEYVRHLDRAPARVRQAALVGVRSAAARAIPELVRRTRSAPPANPNRVGEGGAVDTGNFVRRWRKQDMPNGADVLNDSPQAPVVEGGRRPGKMPPLASIILWVRRKLNVASGPVRERVHGPTGRVTKTRPRRPMSQSMLRSVAFLVARAIGQRGLLARPIMTAADFLEWLRAMAAEEIGREVAQAVAEPSP